MLDAKLVLALVTIISVICSSDTVAEELRKMNYELTNYTVERYFIPHQQQETSHLLPVTRVVLYEDIGRKRMRLVMSFHPAFDEYREARITFVEKPHPVSSFFVLSAPAAFASQYLTLLSTDDVKRFEGVYDRSKPQGSSTITFATIESRLTLESH